MSASATAEHRDAVLAQRAERLAQTHAATVDDSGVDVAFFVVGRERIGVPVAHLREIVELPPITSLPGLPAHFLGIAQVRGELVSVVDMGRYFESETQEPPTLLLLLQTPDGPLGFAIEELIGFRRVRASDISVSETAERNTAGPVSGITSDLQAVLDVEQLLTDPRLRVS